MKKITTQLTIGALAGASLLMPVLAYAQTDKKLSDIITLVVDYITQGLFLIMAVAVLIFIIQVIRYFVLPNENRKEAGMYVMYSVIGFFVIFSLWGLVSIVSATFGIGDNTQHPQTWANIKNIFPTQ
jgi:hypothetical protein